MRRSAEQQYSPWTGVKNFTEVHDPGNSALGAGLGGAASGMAMGQALNSAFGSSPTPGGVPDVKGSVGEVQGQTIAPDEDKTSAWNFFSNSKFGGNSALGQNRMNS